MYQYFIPSYHWVSTPWYACITVYWSLTDIWVISSSWLLDRAGQTSVYDFLCENKLSFLREKCPRIQLWDYIVNPLLILKGTVKLSSRVMYHFTFLPALHDDWFSTCPCHHLVLLLVFIIAVMIGVWWHTADCFPFSYQANMWALHSASQLSACLLCSVIVSDFFLTPQPWPDSFFLPGLCPRVHQSLPSSSRPLPSEMMSLSLSKTENIQLEIPWHLSSHQSPSASSSSTYAPLFLVRGPLTESCVPREPDPRARTEQRAYFYIHQDLTMRTSLPLLHNWLLD